MSSTVIIITDPPDDGEGRIAAAPKKKPVKIKIALPDNITPAEVAQIVEGVLNWRKDDGL